MARKIRENFEEEHIFKATAQLLGEKSSEAKAAFKKIIEDSSQNLTNLKNYVHDLEKSSPLLSHKTFFKIHDNTSLSNNSIFKVAKIIRQDAGSKSIEANLQKAVENHGKQCEKFFSFKELNMTLHEKVNPSLEI